jgi:hypothetical protein
MGILRSSLFAGDRALEACAVSDPAHVVPGAKGAHVRKIQDALDRIANAGLSRTEEYRSSTYGKATTAAVTRFKTDLKIKNHLGQIDPIVGKKTIKALDDELVRLDGVADHTVAATDQSRYLDVVVNFVGGGNGDGDHWAKRGLSLAQYDRPGSKRRFLGIGKGAAVGLPNSVVPAMMELEGALRSDESFGLIFIYGSSLGGRYSIALARLLVAKRIPVTYVGLSDAAFFGTEAINTPLAGAIFGEPTNYPEFLDGRDLPDSITKESYFQKWGNHASRLNRTGRVMWTSSEHGEVHGVPLKFTPRDVSGEVPVGSRGDDGLAHNAACDIADRKIQAFIQARLDGG